MSRRIGMGLACAVLGLGLGLGMGSTMAHGQVTDIERDTKVTGPKGRTIERDINIQRGPGYINRQVEIKRPGETIIRDTRVQTMPGGRPGGPGGFGGPRFSGGPPRFYGGPRVVENVFVQQPPLVSGFVGLPALSLFFGGGGGGGFGGVGAGGFGGGGNPPPPGPGGPPPGPQGAPGFDAFADAIGRLKSFHGSSRRDGALALGRIGDPRAVPALNERLEHDFDKDVRVAAAWALGEIGDEGGAVALQRAVISEKHHHEVRDAATAALKKIPKAGQAPVRSPGGVPTLAPQPLPPTVIRSRPEGLDPGPSSTVPSQPNAEDTPPPPPVPALPTPPAGPIAPALEPPVTTGPFRNPS